MIKLPQKDKAGADPDRISRQKKNLVFILVAAFLFSTMEVALKLAGASYQPLQITFLRFFIGGLCLLPFAILDLKKRGCRLNLGDWGYLLLLGFINICVSMVLFQFGIMETNASLAAVIISINPVFTMVFARFLVKESFTAKKVMVLILSIAGLAVVVDPASLVQGKSALFGLALTVAASVAFGFYTALGKKRIEKIGGLTQNSVSFLLGSLALLVALLATHQPVLAGISLQSLPLLIYLSVFVTALGYYMYLKAIASAGPSFAAMTFFIKPVFAPLIAFAVLGEALTAHLLLGVGFVLAGSLVSAFGDSAALWVSSLRFRHLSMKRAGLQVK